MTVLQLAMVAMQIAYMAVMSRLLAPAEFGAFAIASVVLRLLSYFSDFGMGAAIVQAPEMSKSTFKRANSISVATGFALTALAYFLSPLTSYVSNDPQVPATVGILAFSFAITGIGNGHSAWLRRNHQFKHFAAIEATSYAGGYIVVGIGSALLGLGICSLVLAALTQATVRSALTLSSSSMPKTISVPRNSELALTRFGGTVAVVGFVEFWSSNLDVPAVGRYVGSEGLGQYNRASSLVALPGTYIGDIMTRSLLPGFARLDGPRCARLSLAGLGVLSGVIIPLMAVAATLSQDLVLGVLGPQWEQAARVLPFVCAAVAINTLTKVPATALESQGFVRTMLYVQLAHFATVVASIAAVVLLNGPLWSFALAWAVGELARHLLYLLAMWRKLGRKTAGALLDYLAACIIALVASLAAWGGSELADIHLAAVLLGGLAALATWCAVLATTHRWPLRSAMRTLNLHKELPNGRLGRLLSKVIV